MSDCDQRNGWTGGKEFREEVVRKIPGVGLQTRERKIELPVRQQNNAERKERQSGWLEFCAP